jgi:hypothetical protein
LITDSQCVAQEKQSKSLQISSPPGINSIYARRVSTVSAILYTSFTTLGSVTNAWFEWGTTTQYGNITPKQQSNYSIDYTLNGLEPNTVYHFRSIVENDFGRSESEDRYFITTPPTIINFSVLNPTATSIRFSVSCNPNGQPTEILFAWRPTYASMGDIWYWTTPKYIGNGTSIITITDSLTGLTPEGVYDVFLVARNKDMPDTWSVSRGKTFVTMSDPNSGGFSIELSLPDIMTPNPMRHGFGVHTHASYCKDDVLGEILLPPSPPLGAQDLRFVDIRTDSGACMDNGMNIDLRKYYSSTQVDTYMFKIQPDTRGYPILISWQDLNSNYSGPVRLLSDMSERIINVDMKSQTSYILYYKLTYLYILAEGPKNVIWSKANLISPDTAILVGKFNPNGSASEAWFEWGKTQKYGKVSIKQTLGDGQENVIFSEWVDSLQPNTKYFYRAVTKTNEGISYGIENSFTTNFQVNVKDENNLPDNFLLLQNYPNPFNPTTVISWQSPVSSWVTLKVYNLLGQEVATLVNEKREAGKHRVEFDGSRLPSGVYFYRLVASEFVSVKKFILIK